MISAAAGTSKNRDAYQAGFEACSLAIQKLNDKPDFLFVFNSPALDPTEVIRGVQQAGERVPLIGCSDAGELTNEGPSQNGAVVLAVRADTVRFITGFVKDDTLDARSLGRALAKDVKSHSTESVKTLILFADLLGKNGTEIIQGVQDVFGASLPIVGGAAGDDFLFKKTYQYRDIEIDSGAISGVGLTGSFSSSISVRHGWIPIGPPMKITKAQGNVLYEIQGHPAVTLYEDYFGGSIKESGSEPFAKKAITYPLGIKVPDIEEYAVFYPLTVQADGSILFTGTIPQGVEARLMIGSKDKAVEAAKIAAREISAAFTKTNVRPKLLIVFNSVAREKLFGSRARDEIDAILNIIGRDVPMAGFYTYGEFAPAQITTNGQTSSPSRFFNETMVLFAIGD